MAEALLWIAALGACVPALIGDRTAIVLLSSLLYVSVLERLQVPFHPAIWVAADVAVLALIVRRGMRLRDELIAILMLMAWVGYAMGAESNYAIGLFVVTAQLLLTLAPPRRRYGQNRVAKGAG
jgi:uncharacterized membrane protein